MALSTEFLSSFRQIWNSHAVFLLLPIALFIGLSGHFSTKKELLYLSAYIYHLGKSSPVHFSSNLELSYYLSFFIYHFIHRTFRAVFDKKGTFSISLLYLPTCPRVLLSAFRQIWNFCTTVLFFSIALFIGLSELFSTKKELIYLSTLSPNLSKSSPKRFSSNLELSYYLSFFLYHFIHRTFRAVFDKKGTFSIILLISPLCLGVLLSAFRPIWNFCTAFLFSLSLYLSDFQSCFRQKRNFFYLSALSPPLPKSSPRALFVKFGTIELPFCLYLPSCPTALLNSYSTNMELLCHILGFTYRFIHRPSKVIFDKKEFLLSSSSNFLLPFSTF